MFKAKQLIIGIGALATAGILVSFAGEDEGKKKKYHVIHHKDGVMMEFDTILPMSSQYSVEDFLAEKGIESDNVEIIKVPQHGPNMVFMSNGGPHHHMVMHHLDEEVMISDENGKREEVKIIREKGKDGEITVKKFVNGEEVELSEEEKKHLSEKRPHPMRFHMQEERIDGTDRENVEMKVEVDKEGNLTVQKFVDGEEVEETEEEMERIQKRHDAHKRHHIIRIEDGNHEGMRWHHNEGGKNENVEMKVEIDKEGNMTVQKFVNGEEVEVTEEEMNHIRMHHEKMGDRKMILIEEEGHLEQLDSLLQEFEIEIEEFEGEEGAQRVIIKEIHFDSEEQMEGSTEIHKEMRFHHNIDVEGEGEDFTIVLVTENLDETVEIETSSNIRSMTMNEPISVYPNPNHGTFTIAFDQKEKVKTAVEIVDAQGKVVFKEKLGSFAGSYKKEVNLEKHGKGVYIVKVQQGDETSARKVIVE